LIRWLRGRVSARAGGLVYRKGAHSADAHGGRQGQSMGRRSGDRTGRAFSQCTRAARSASLTRSILLRSRRDGTISAPISRSMIEACARVHRCGLQFSNVQLPQTGIRHRSQRRSPPSSRQMPPCLPYFPCSDSSALHNSACGRLNARLAASMISMPIPDQS
jgi:hypothetical protein